MLSRVVNVEDREDLDTLLALKISVRLQKYAPQLFNPSRYEEGSRYELNNAFECWGSCVMSCHKILNWRIHKKDSSLAITGPSQDDVHEMLCKLQSNLAQCCLKMNDNHGVVDYCN